MASLFEELELGLQQAIETKEGKLEGRKTVIVINPSDKENCKEGKMSV